MTTTKALTMCTKYVLSPYHIFLKIVSYNIYSTTHTLENDLYALAKCI